MKLSILTTIGNTKQDATERGDAWQEALANYAEMADEVVVVDGTGSIKNISSVIVNKKSVYLNGKIRVVRNPWPYSWSWQELPKHLNDGLDRCSGDWVIKLDIDQLFHENDMQTIRELLNDYKSFPVATFQKFSFVIGDKYYEKGKIPLAINNGRFKDRIRFGHATNADTDLCYPIFVNGETNKKGVPLGEYQYERFVHTGKPIYNYDYTFKTEKQTRDEFWRFAAAYKRYYGQWKFGSTKEMAFEVFIDMMKGRSNRCIYHLPIERHPRHIQAALRDLKSTQFGHSGFGLL